MTVSRDLPVLSTGVRVGADLGARMLSAFGLLLSGLLLYLLLLLFPGAEERSLHPLRALRQLGDAPGGNLVFWYVLGTVAILVWIWTVVGGALQRMTILRLAGLPAGSIAATSHALKRWASHLGAPCLVLTSAAFLGAVVYGMAQVVRIPYAGWPMLALLSPLLLVIAGAAIRLLLRWLLAGHLAGPAIAEGNADAFRAMSRAFAYHRRAPWTGIRVRIASAAAFLGHALFRTGVAVAAAFAGWLVLGLLPGEPQETVERALTLGFADGGTAARVATASILVLAGLLAAWIASIPAGMFFTSRAACYLVLRRDLDGVPVDEAGARLVPEKTLEELGFELVRRLREEVEEE